MVEIVSTTVVSARLPRVFQFVRGSDMILTPHVLGARPAYVGVRLLFRVSVFRREDRAKGGNAEQSN
jgi:hypothetical protein